MGSEWTPAYKWEEYAYIRDWREVPARPEEYEALQQAYNERLELEQAAAEAALA
jgi:hypothetical protein